MKTKKTTDEKIELRSEKVRQLIGEIPPSLVRWGAVVIALVFISLIISLCLVPYPYSGGGSILRYLLGFFINV